MGLVLLLSASSAFSLALFSAFDGALLKPLPFREPDGLFIVGPKTILTSGPGPMAPTEFDELRRNPSVERACAFAPGLFHRRFADAELLHGIEVHGECFETLGMPPLLGRTLEGEDDVAGVRAGVISYGLWRSRFGGDATVINEVKELGGERLRIVGVMPPEFELPAGANVWARAAPLRLRYLTAIVRSRINSPPHLVLSSGELLSEPLSRFFQPARKLNLILLFICGTVLVMLAWIHVASLQITAALASPAPAVKLALGAPMSTLCREWFVEAFALAAAVAAVSLLLLPVMLPYVAALLPSDIAVHLEVLSPGRLMVFHVILGAMGALVMGLAPSIAVRNAWSRGTLRVTFGADALSRRQGRGAIIVVQLSLASTLLYLAAASSHAVVSMEQRSLGSDVKDVAEVEMPGDTGLDRAQLFRLAAAAIRSVPGVVSVAGGDLPLNVGRVPVAVSLTAMSRQTAAQDRDATRLEVSGEFFRTAGVAVAVGRSFRSENDEPGSATVLSESVARSLGEPAAIVGRQIYVNGLPAVVVGVAADANLGEPARPVVRAVYRLCNDCDTLIFRTAVTPQSVRSLVDARLHEIPGLRGPLRFRFGSDLYRDLMKEHRSRAALAGIVGTMSLLIGGLGAVSLALAHVRRQRREIAIRLSLGATPAGLATQFAQRIVVQAAVGAALGATIGLFVAGFARTMFPGINPYDPLSVAFSFVTVVAAALVSVIPIIRHASRADLLELIKAV